MAWHSDSETHAACPCCIQLPCQGISFFRLVAIVHSTAFSSGQVGSPDKPQACDYGSVLRSECAARGGAPLAARVGEGR